MTEIPQPIHRVVRGAHPEIRDLLLAAHKQRFRVTLTRNGHYRVQAPRCSKKPRLQRVAFVAGTPSDYRTPKNTRAQLRKIGVRFA